MRRAGLYAGLAVFAAAQAGFAATWAVGTTPHLGRIFAVDATGEGAWPYGAEDVLGDGPQNFTPAEQALDLRTAYAATDATQFWTRVYLSSGAQTDPTLVTFVFVDADGNTATGGGTNSTTLSPAFTSEHSPGGYEYVIGIGNATLPRVWQWQAPNWVEVTLTAAQGVVETGTDTDPIRIGPAAHAYVQARVDLSVVGVTAACDANLYVRSARATGASDLDMTFSTSCIPAKTNGVPTIVVAPCTSDAQCPENGICDNGQCLIAPPCGATADCAAGDTCTADGRCVPAGACTPGGNECAAGTRCAPTGACVPGGATGNGEVEGGAFHCNVSNGPRGTFVLFALGALLGLFYVRRRR
ncbi:MAG TPA: hypothetical protein VGH28_18935 [Polyangiaceae bacterium]|jgi:hypothetical protein